MRKIFPIPPIRFFSRLSFLLVLVVPVEGQSQNLIKNPDCNKGTFGWVNPVSRNTKIFRSAPASCQVLYSGKNYISLDDNPASVVKPEAGKRYTASAYVRTNRASSVGKPVKIVLRQRGGKQAVRGTYSPVTKLADYWQQISVSSGIDVGRTSLEVYIVQDRAVRGNGFQVDDVVLIKEGDASSPPPTPPTPSPTPDPSQPAPTLFHATSPFNVPIPANSTVDPNSGIMRNSLVNDAKARGAVIAWKEWSVPLFLADAKTPRYTIKLVKFQISGFTQLSNVPIPDAAIPDNKQDGHMTILDSSTGCLYDFWQASKVSGVWRTSWANRMYVADSGVYPMGASTRGSGFANLAGVIFPDELLGSGEIKHALIFSSGMNRKGGPVAPATESDGPFVGNQYIPEGARVRLRPDFDLSKYPEYLQKIGKALKIYGAYNADNSGGGFSFYALNTRAGSMAFGAGTKWPWGDDPYPKIPMEFIQNLEVLKLPPQVKPSVKALQHPCGAYK